MATSKLKPTKLKLPAASKKLKTVPVNKSKKAEVELSNSAGLLDAVFHTADIGIAVISLDGKVIKANSGYCHMFGYECGELIGKPWFKIIAPVDLKAVKQAHSKIALGKPLSHERKAIRKDGKFIDIYLTNNLLKNTDGTKYIIKTVRDISESNRYKNLLHQTEKITKIGGFELDGISRKIIWTDELYDIHGVEKDFVPTPTNILQFFGKEDVRRIKQSFRDIFSNGTDFDFELQLHAGNKINKWIRIIGKPVRFKSKTTQVIGTIQDITAQKTAEDEIERLSWVATHTNSPVLIADKNREIEWVNNSFEKLTGYTLEDIKGKKPGEVLKGPVDDAKLVGGIINRLKKKLPSKGDVLQRFTKDGRMIWISSDIAPILKEGKVINYVGIITDLTELMKAKELQEKQETLLEQQKLFNAVSRYFPNGIIGVINQDLNYVFVGGTELKKLGLTHHKMIGDKVFDKIHPELNEYAESFLKRTFTNEKVSFDVSVSGNSYSIIAVPIKDDDEPITQSLVVIQNITQTKKTQEELLTALQKQKELSELKSKFVSIASHEFRTPLSTILSSSFLVGKYNKPEDEQRREKHLERIKASVNNLTFILNDFLSVGKVEDGGIRNRPGLFNINSFFKELIDEMQPYLKTGQLVIFSHKGNEMVYLDRPHLKNVFINLLSNAIKYSPENKPIHLDSIYGKDSLDVKVSDKGIGIPEADQKHLFETFFRANNVSNIQGTGMGLNIVKKYLDIMGGSIEFKSRENEGSAFTVRYPQGKITQSTGS